MSLYKIDGHVLSVNDLVTWVGGFISLHDKGLLKKKKIPEEVKNILNGPQDIKEKTMTILEYLRNNDEFMDVLIKIVQEGVTEIAMDKNS